MTGTATLARSIRRQGNCLHWEVLRPLQETPRRTGRHPGSSGTAIPRRERRRDRRRPRPLACEVSGQFEGDSVPP